MYMIAVRIFLVTASFLAINSAFAAEDCKSGVESNSKIITCSQASYVKIDKILNEQYKALASELNASVKSELLSVQRNWVRFKDSYCEDESDKGAEAPINRISCMSQITSFRVGEIIYLRTGIVGDGFSKAVSLVRESGRAMKYGGPTELTNESEDFGALWTNYAHENCTMVKKMYDESLDKCMARMRFQLPIY